MTKYKVTDFTECDGVDLLSIKLRSSGRIFTHFASNDKRPIYDGDFDLLNEDLTIKRVFRGQVKSTNSFGDSFRVAYKYLQAITSRVSLDPFYFFVVSIPTSEFFYINLSTYNRDAINKAVKKKRGLSIKKSSFTKIEDVQLFVDELTKYSAYFTEKKLSQNEIRLLMNGITYLNDALDKMPLIKNMMFPNLYSFYVDYARDTDEGFTRGLYSKKHNVLAIYPVFKESNNNLIGYFDEEGKKYKFISRHLEKDLLTLDSFKSYLQFILREAFAHIDKLLSVFPDIIIEELLYGAIGYEAFTLLKHKYELLYKSETLAASVFDDIHLSESNVYSTLFNAALNETKRRGMPKIHKLWWYFEKNTDVKPGEKYAVFNTEKLDLAIDRLLELLPYVINDTLKVLLPSEAKKAKLSRTAFQFEFDQNSVTVLKIPYNYYSRVRLSPEELCVMPFKSFSQFENMNTYAPLFLTTEKYLMSYLCELFEVEEFPCGVDSNQIAAL